MKTQIYTNKSGLAHNTGTLHPECPERLKILLELFNEDPFCTLPLIEAKPVKLEWLEYAHPKSYINKIKAAIPERGLVDLDGEVVLSPQSWEAALTSVGAVCQAVEDTLTNKCDRAFCAVRPPGHHAEAERAMGFCIFSNIFIAARYAQKHFGIKHIAIIDPDVHHGNGTDSLARKQDNIFFVSTHQSMLYPGTGFPEDDIEGRIINIPLLSGSGSDIFRRAYLSKALPALDKFSPELVLISAGFDAHTDDPLASLNLLEDDYAWLTEKICEIASKHCNGKVISSLEGGYNLKALKSSVAAHIKALANL